MICKHGAKMFRQENGAFPDDCACGITRRRGYADGRQGHPPAELSKEYLYGYQAGLEQQGHREP